MVRVRQGAMAILDVLAILMVLAATFVRLYVGAAGAKG